MRLLTLAACLLVPATTAAAASFDCARATTAIEKTICGDPALSKADERLAEVYASAVAVSLSPSTVRAEQSRWLAQRDKLTSVDALRQAYRMRVDALAATTEKARALRRDVTVESAGKNCVVPPDAPDDSSCSVDEFGVVAGSRDAFRYQLQSYREGELRVAGGAVVFRSNAGRLTPVVATAIDSAHFSAPAIVQSPAARLLVIPGHMEGTGNFNADLVFRLDDGRLAEIDTESWLGDLQKRLPKGWGAWKGIFPRYDQLTAETPLWKDGDGNCCPTAGRAFIRLGLNNRRLTLVELRIRNGEIAARGQP